MLAPQLHLFQLGELAQAGVEDGVGLSVGEREGLDQPRLRLLLEADDADHLVQVEEDDEEAFEDVQPVGDLAEAPVGAPPVHLPPVIEEGLQAGLHAEHARRSGLV